MVTMADVAVKAGVSRSTVSLVLNGRHQGVGICEETCRRVRQTAEQLGYRRNELARAMITGRNPFLCVITGQLDDELATRCLAAAVAEAEAQRQYLHVVRVADQAGIERLIELRPAGVLSWNLAPALQGPLSTELDRYDIPLVALYAHHGGPWLRAAVGHLLELGHRRIALVQAPADAAVTAVFNELVVAAEAPTPEEWLLAAAGPEELREPLKELLRGRRPRPTAVVCGSDAVAAAVLRAARRAELRVGKDLSVVGCGDSAAAALMDPPLTSVALPVAALAAHGVARLLGLEALTAVQPPAPEVVARRSTGPA
jgi:DNA-binding LacI/PurR family transcriptional regulator